MRWLKSLRARLFVGSILWSIGLLFVAHVISVFVVHAYFGSPPDIRLSQKTFHTWLATAVVISVVAMLFGFRHVRKGLSALDRLHRAVGALRAGQSRRIDGAFPSEVTPLVEDLNALLEQRERAVTRAQEKAADLAHGLKTPLAVLAQEAADASAAGHAHLGRGIEQQVERMRRQIDYQLAQARAAASGAVTGASAGVQESVSGLKRALDRIHAGRALRIDLEGDSEARVRVERQDLDELLGNVLDNGCRWAATRVRVRWQTDGERCSITVEDDGPGLAAELRDAVLQRGVRADQREDGAGLGLAITRELVGLYGGSMRLEDSALGGLSLRIDLPASGG